MSNAWKFIWVNPVNQLIKAILVSIITIVYLAQFVPAYSTQPSACACCNSTTCNCGCTHNKASSKAPPGTDIPTCDFNTCNGTAPFNASPSIFLTSSFTELIKKLGSYITLHTETEAVCSFRLCSGKQLLMSHLLSPPPAFLLNSCFIL